ncbi:hypothetical protein MKX03_000857 [Papaver bracteatum]|nr:hypothetical protein MKX03_000857 [Papaver bracteatum]
MTINESKTLLQQRLNVNERRKKRIRCGNKDDYIAETSEQLLTTTRLQSQDHEEGTFDNQLFPTTQMVTLIGSWNIRRNPRIIEQLKHRALAGTSIETGMKRQHEIDPVLAATENERRQKSQHEIGTE